MRNFFKPWRRKIGVVTLLIACVFAAGWIRSYQNFDDLKVLSHTFFSSDGVFGELTFTIDHQVQGGRVVATVSASPAWQFLYSLITIPLTLLSAWLLLTKPPKKTTEPVLPTGP